MVYLNLPVSSISNKENLFVADTINVLLHNFALKAIGLFMYLFCPKVSEFNLLQFLNS